MTEFEIALARVALTAFKTIDYQARHYAHSWIMARCDVAEMSEAELESEILKLGSRIEDAGSLGCPPVKRSG